MAKSDLPSGATPGQPVRTGQDVPDVPQHSTDAGDLLDDVRNWLVPPEERLRNRAKVRKFFDGTPLEQPVADLIPPPASPPVGPASDAWVPDITDVTTSTKSKGRTMMSTPISAFGPGTGSGAGIRASGADDTGGDDTRDTRDTRDDSGAEISSMLGASLIDPAILDNDFLGVTVSAMVSPRLSALRAALRELGYNVNVSAIDPVALGTILAPVQREAAKVAMGLGKSPREVVHDAGITLGQIARAVGTLIVAPVEDSVRTITQRLLLNGSPGATDAGDPSQAAPSPAIQTVVEDTLYVDGNNGQWVGSMTPAGQFQSRAPLFGRVLNVQIGHAYAMGPPDKNGSPTVTTDLGPVQPVPMLIPTAATVPNLTAPKSTPWGPYRPGVHVFLRGRWYLVNAHGRPENVLSPQPPAPPVSQREALLNAARRVPHVAPHQVPPRKLPAKHPAHAPAHARESAPPANMLPSQIANTVQTIGSVLSTGMSIVKTGMDIASSVGSAFGGL